MNTIGNATADVAYPNWRITRRSLGVGGYFNEVPRALPVGLHDAVYHLVALLKKGTLITTDRKYYRKAAQAGNVVMLEDFSIRI